MKIQIIKFTHRFFISLQMFQHFTFKELKEKIVRVKMDNTCFQHNPFYLKCLLNGLLTVI
uniref:Uncharacterized protein n=1 Tax=Tetranychus urticae TaxID=32264 RepID=T1KKW1_TETUR